MRGPLALFFALLTGFGSYPFEEWKNEITQNCAILDPGSCSSSQPVWETILLFPVSLISGETVETREQSPEWWQAWWNAVTIPTNTSDLIRTITEHGYIARTIKDIMHEATKRWADILHETSKGWADIIHEILCISDLRTNITDIIHETSKGWADIIHENSKGWIAIIHEISEGWIAIIHETWNGWTETMQSTYEDICTWYKHRKERFLASIQVALDVLVTWSDDVTEAVLSCTHFLTDRLVHVHKLLSNHLDDVYGPFAHAFGEGVAFCFDYRSFLVPYQNIFWLSVVIIACVLIVKRYRARHKPRSRPRRNVKGIALRRSMKRDLEITEHTYQTNNTCEQPTDQQTHHRGQRRRVYNMANQQWLSPQQFGVYYDANGESCLPHASSHINQIPVSLERYRYLAERRNHLQSNTDVQEYPFEHRTNNGSRGVVWEIAATNQDHPSTPCSSKTAHHHDKVQESAEKRQGNERFDDSTVRQERQGINSSTSSDVFEDAITDLANNDEFWNNEDMSNKFNYSDYNFDSNRATHKRVTFNDTPDEIYIDESGEISEGSSFDSSEQSDNFHEHLLFASKKLQEHVVLADDQNDTRKDAENKILFPEANEDSSKFVIFQNQDACKIKPNANTREDWSPIREDIHNNNTYEDDTARLQNGTSQHVSFSDTTVESVRENQDKSISEKSNLCEPSTLKSVYLNVASTNGISESNENEYKPQQYHDNPVAFNTDSRDTTTLDNTLSESNEYPFVNVISEVENESQIDLCTGATLGNYISSNEPRHQDIATEVNPMQDACTSTSFESNIEEENDSDYMHESDIQDAKHAIMYNKNQSTAMTGKVDNTSQQLQFLPESEDHIRKPYSIVDSSQSRVSPKRRVQTNEIYTTFDESIPTLVSQMKTHSFTAKDESAVPVDGSNVFTSINPTKDTTSEWPENDCHSRSRNYESDGSMYFSPASSPRAGLKRPNRPIGGDLDASMDSDIGRPWCSSSFRDESPCYLGGRRPETGDGPMIITRRSPHQEQGISFMDESTISNTEETNLLDVSDINRSLSYNSGDGVFEFLVMFTVQSAYRMTKRFWQDQQTPERKVVNISGGDGAAATGDVFIIPSPRKQSKRRYNRRNRSANAAELDISERSSYVSAPEASMDTSFSSTADEQCELDSEDCSRFSHSSRASWQSAASRLNNGSLGFSNRYCTSPSGLPLVGNGFQGSGNDRTGDKYVCETNAKPFHPENESRQRVLEYLDDLNKDSSKCGTADKIDPNIHSASSLRSSGTTNVCNHQDGSKSESIENVKLERAKIQQCTIERGQFSLDVDGYLTDSTD